MLLLLLLLLFVIISYITHSYRSETYNSFSCVFEFHNDSVSRYQYERVFWPLWFVGKWDKDYDPLRAVLRRDHVNRARNARSSSKNVWKIRLFQITRLYDYQTRPTYLLETFTRCIVKWLSPSVLVRWMEIDRQFKNICHWRIKTTETKIRAIDILPSGVHH